MMADSTPRYADAEVDRPDEDVEKTTTTNVNDGGRPITEEDDESEGPTSSVGNIIPMDKLKNGWFALSSFVTVSSFPTFSFLFLPLDSRYCSVMSMIIGHILTITLLIALHTEAFRCFCHSKNFSLFLTVGSYY